MLAECTTSRIASRTRHAIADKSKRALCPLLTVQSLRCAGLVRTSLTARPWSSAMTRTLLVRWRILPSLTLLVAAALLAPCSAGAHTATEPSPTAPVLSAGQAAAPMTVAQARASQNGATATVRGYVVGQPTASDTVVRSGFPNDYAMALADTAVADQHGPMLYVQIPAAFRPGAEEQPVAARPAAGRHRHAERLLRAAGLTSATAFVRSGTSTPTSTPTTSPDQHDRATRTPPTTRQRPARAGPRCATRCTRSSRPRPC